MRLKTLALGLALLGTTALPAWSAGPVDYSLYAELLGKYVKKGVVNYAGFKKEEAKLDRFLKVLERVDTKKLSSSQQMAFYINVYNAWTIKLILSKYPGVKSIKEIGGWFSSPWKQEIVRIEGKVYHLDNIEHDILRPRFKDPRVHFAVNCASKGCPPLLSEPYLGARLNQQLNQVTTAFINDPSRTYLKDGTLYVTKIMDWFSRDFNKDPYGFVLKYARGEFKQRLLKAGKGVEVDYLYYDWSLNGS